MTMTLTRRCALALGAGAALSAVAWVARARAFASEIRIGWQKGGDVALLKGTGALEKTFAERVSASAG